MSSLYLTPDEVKELTGYVTQAAARRWLERNDWPYAQPAGDGWSRSRAAPDACHHRLILPPFQQ